MSFKNISTEQHAAFVSSLKAGQYNLLLGAGVSLDSYNVAGKLPSGGMLRDDLCNLKKVSKNKSLQKVFSLLSDEEIKDFITNRFSGCTPGETLKALSSFIWRRAFTWNIDDATEAAYKLKGAKQNLQPIHFRDDYNDERNLADLMLVKLHGSVTQPERKYVFSRDEYIQVMKDNSPWMTVLSQFLTREPFIIAGASMDEVDLDFYLSYRTSMSGRDDQGPSILVEPYPDAVTENECASHNLLLYKGTALDFFHYCQNVAPNRPTPYELIPTEAQNILPSTIDSAEALAFYADFELVPASEKMQPGASRFFYGHSPSWEDFASSFDISRSVTASIVNAIEDRIVKTSEEIRLFVLTDVAGAGKTTVIRRIAFELAKRGIHTLLCSALSRLEHEKTLRVIDGLQGPLFIVVDNFADQVSSIADLLSKTEKKDIIVLASERNYRNRYIFQSLSGVPFERISALKLRDSDVGSLIDKYTELGIVGASRAILDRSSFIKSTKEDPIAVVCCRILNDFRPLDRISDDLMQQCNSIDQDRYLVASLAQYCFGGGVRHEILAAALASEGYREQLSKEHPLPLSYYDRTSNSHVIPQNATIATRILDNIARRDTERLLGLFVKLAVALAPRVNRRTIKQRSSEARLASRLFDFDSVVDSLLKELAPRFYERTQQAWQWNSRYWEQVALMNVARHNQSRVRGQTTYLDEAVQNARHATSIENHPLPLTTLSKILFIQMAVPGYSMAGSFSEAFDCSDRAITIEKSWSRKSVHPYVTMFRGVKDYLDRSGQMSSTQIQRTRDFMRDAEKLFPRDQEIRDTILQVKTML